MKTFLFLVISFVFTFAMYVIIATGQKYTNYCQTKEDKLCIFFNF